MPAAIAIPAIIGAASSVYGASKQASAAKQAARTQAGSAQQALNLLGPLTQQAIGAQQAGLAQTNQLYAPYAQLGASTLGALTRGVGLPSAPAGPPMPAGPAVPQMGYPGGMAPLSAVPGMSAGAAGVPLTLAQVLQRGGVRR